MFQFMTARVAVATATATTPAIFTAPSIRAFSASPQSSCPASRSIRAKLNAHTSASKRRSQRPPRQPYIQAVNSSRPNTYKKMQAMLLGESEPHRSRLQMPQDGKEGLEKARAYLLEREMAAGDKKKKEKVGGCMTAVEAFRMRLRNDGGDKIVIFKKNVLHTDYKRFIPLFSEIKGLPLDQALLQVKWLRKRISRKVESILEGAIVKAKDQGLDLSKTYLADGYVKKDGAIISKELQRRYIRGRGRYGATPHPLTCLVEITLQERERGFKKREADPLEWVRARLRDRQREWTKTPDQIYQEVKSRRVEKVIYN